MVERERGVVGIRGSDASHDRVAADPDDLDDYPSTEALLLEQSATVRDLRTAVELLQEMVAGLRRRVAEYDR